jgi:CRISPR-associated protein Csx14
MQNSSNRAGVLLATLGSEPQVITAAYDLLIDQGEKIERLRVLYTYCPDTPIATAVNRLRLDFPAPASIDFIPITSDNNQAVADVNTPETAKAAFKAIYRAVWAAKRSNRRVHLCIAGGRKTMAVYGMTTAQLLFDEDDHLWHLFSSGDFLTSKRLHPHPGDDVHLVEIPVILWGEVTPAAWILENVDDPYVAIDRVRGLQLNEKMETARSFLQGSLTPAELRVVELLVREGLSDNEIAERLYLSPRTVEQHLRSAYSKAGGHWEMEQVGRTQLVTLLNLYFNMKITGNPA